MGWVEGPEGRGKENVAERTEGEWNNLRGTDGWISYRRHLQVDAVLKFGN